MSLPNDIARCRGFGTAEGKPDSDCLACERRLEGIADYMAGKRTLWMAPPAQKPCPQQLESGGPRRA